VCRNKKEGRRIEKGGICFYMPLNHVHQQHIIWRTRLEMCEERPEAFHGRVGGETVGGGHGGMMMRNHGRKKEADGERIRIKCR